MVDAVNREDVAAKYRAWGWNVLEVDGNNPAAISEALDSAYCETQRPTLIIGHTAMGKGAVKADGTCFEGQCSTHGQPLSSSGADYAATIANLGGNPEEPFEIFADVATLYAERADELRRLVAIRRQDYQAWSEANPILAAELEGYLAGRLPEIDYKAIAHKPGTSTRQASADVLGVLAQQVRNMIVGSADLANSDKTDGFLKKTRALTRGDFGGAFLQAGVAELTLACIMNGIALHGGLEEACGTFFVFSDYMKPAVRLAALMELPVKYIWTHDAFRVGEDGPTHEPVEQEAQIRLMEQIRNFSGRPSLLALRPADAAETSVAWKMAMDNHDTPTALILSRQDIPDLPAPEGTDRYTAALGALKGGYTVVEAAKPDVVLVANGSEVSLLCEVAVLLEAEGIHASVVSMPSIGLFNVQPADYRASVLPAGVPQFGLTAGLPASLRMIEGFTGKVFGLERFGASAPYKVLDEKFGFTASNILACVAQYLGRTLPDMPR